MGRVQRARLVPLHAASIVISLPGHILFELGRALSSKTCGAWCLTGEGYLFGFQKAKALIATRLRDSLSRAQGLELAFVGKALGAIAAFGVGRSVGCRELGSFTLRDASIPLPATLLAEAARISASRMLSHCGALASGCSLQGLCEIACSPGQLHRKQPEVRV